MPHLFRVVIAIAVILSITLLPFLPGRYDRLAVPLSGMAQLFGFVGPLLVPVGVAWIATERLAPTAGRRYGFAIVTLVVSSFVCFVLSLVGFVSESLVLGIVLVALWAYVLWRAVPWLRALKTATPGAPSVVPVYLIVVPVACCSPNWQRSGA